MNYRWMLCNTFETFRSSDHRQRNVYGKRAAHPRAPDLSAVNALHIFVLSLVVQHRRWQSHSMFSGWQIFTVHRWKGAQNKRLRRSKATIDRHEAHQTTPNSSTNNKIYIYIKKSNLPYLLTQRKQKCLTFLFCRFYVLLKNFWQDLGFYTFFYYFSFSILFCFRQCLLNVVSYWFVFYSHFFFLFIVVTFKLNLLALPSASASVTRWTNVCPGMPCPYVRTYTHCRRKTVFYFDCHRSRKIHFRLAFIQNETPSNEKCHGQLFAGLFNFRIWDFSSVY